MSTEKSPPFAADVAAARVTRPDMNVNLHTAMANDVSTKTSPSKALQTINTSPDGQEQTSRAASDLLPSHETSGVGELEERSSRRASHDGYTPHAPPSRPPSSLLTASNSPAPALPRRRISIPSAQAAPTESTTVAPASAAPPVPSLVSRRMWTHYPEREVLVANPPSHPAERSAEAEAVRVTRTRSLTVAAPLKPSSAQPTTAAAVAPAARPTLCAHTLSEKSIPELQQPHEDVHAEEGAGAAVSGGSARPATFHNTNNNNNGMDVQGEVFQKVQSTSSSMLPSPVATDSILLPRSLTRLPAPSTFSPTSLRNDDDDGDVPEAARLAEREASSPSPFRASSCSARQEDSVRSIPSHYTLPAEPKPMPGFLPSFPAASTSWSEEREAMTALASPSSGISNPGGAAGAGGRQSTTVSGGGGMPLGSVSSQPPPPAVSFTRPRLHQNAPSRRFSRQVSLSFDYAEEEKAEASVTNSDSFPPHGLSPSSAVPSDAYASALPAAPLVHGDFCWRGRSGRVDGRSTTSSASSPPRQDLDALPPPRCASTTLSERRVSQTTAPLQPSASDTLPPPQSPHDTFGGTSGSNSNTTTPTTKKNPNLGSLNLNYSGSFGSNAARRVESATFRPAHPFSHQTPRTRSAAYSATARGPRVARLHRSSVDTSATFASTTPYPRSLSSHSARHGFPAADGANSTTNFQSMSSDNNNMNNNRANTFNSSSSGRASIGATPSGAEAPLLPHLNPLLHSPSSAPRFSGSQPPLTPLHMRASTTSSAGFEGPASDIAVPSSADLARVVRSHSISADDFSPFAHVATPLAFPLTQHQLHQQLQHNGHSNVRSTSTSSHLRNHPPSALPSIQTTPVTTPGGARAESPTAGGAAEGAEETAASVRGVGRGSLSSGCSGRRRSTPRQSRVSFSVPSTPQPNEPGNADAEAEAGGVRDVDRTAYSSVLEYSELDGEEGEEAAHGCPSPSPPPPPWTPAEALYWMSGRLTRQEAMEMQQYDRVYYCGPAVPPRTACGVTEAAPTSPSERGDDGGVDRDERAEGTSSGAGSEDPPAQDFAATVGLATAASPVAASLPPTARSPTESASATAAAGGAIAAPTNGVLPSSPASPASYFPITLGMHISFRYEVAEVLGFGTFSVVVRAIDHAAPQLSPERHCALKLIRKEALYQQAALDEWEVYEHIKASCEGLETSSREGEATDGGPTSSPRQTFPHHLQRLCPFPSPFRPSSSSFSFTWRLTPSDQRTLLVASVLTPRTRFEFRGYHVIAFPLLGFNVRDVLELQREHEETTTAAAAAASIAASGPMNNTQSAPLHSDEVTRPATPGKGEDREGSAVFADPRNASSVTTSAFPPHITASILAQVVHALAFLHHEAHLLHGDLKPENVVFVDRTLSQGIPEGSATLPLYEHHFLHRSSSSAVGANADGAESAAFYTPATTPISFVSLLQSSGALNTSSAPHASHLLNTPHSPSPSDARDASSNSRAGATLPETHGGEEPQACCGAATPNKTAATPSKKAARWLTNCEPTSAEAIVTSAPMEEDQRGRSEEGGEQQFADALAVGGGNVGADSAKEALSAVSSPMSRDLPTSSLSVLYAPHTPSRQTPGLTASRTGTLPSSPHLHSHHHPADALTLDDGHNSSADDGEDENTNERDCSKTCKGSCGTAIRSTITSTKVSSPNLCAADSPRRGQPFSRPRHFLHDASSIHSHSSGSNHTSNNNSNDKNTNGTSTTTTAVTQDSQGHHGHRSSGVQSPLSSCGSSPVSAWGTSSRVAVIDLGHAKPLAPGQTGVAFPLQSPSYRAPEMALRLPYTTAIDMWSLGCVLYELRTGRVLFPGASDDATLLTAAVTALGMPDTNFLSMVKVCWKEYKQRKASGAGSAVLPSRSSSVAVYGTSLSVYLTEQGEAELEADREAAAVGSLYKAHPDKSHTERGSGEGTRPVFALSEEEVAVEKCWRSFIQVLNTAAGQQRARTEKQRRQSTSIYVSANVSRSMSLSKAPEAVPAAATPSDDGSTTVWSVTTWETAAQAALLSDLFPDGHSNTDEHTFTLRVAERYCRSSAASLSTLEEKAEGRRPPAWEAQRADYVWADFLLGCLYWDAAERLSSAEAQRHPYIAANFLHAPTNVSDGEEAKQREGDAQQRREPRVAMADCPPHCSGVFYLQHHPLTARLFTAASPPVSGRRRPSREGDKSVSNSQSVLEQSRRRPSAFLPLLPLAPAAIVPFELPSNKRTAPSARAWEEHQHLQQQETQQQQQPYYSMVTDGNLSEGNGRLTPSGQRLSVFCGRSPSPEDGLRACASVATTTPFRIEFHDSDERASTRDGDLLSPNRIIEMEEGEGDDDNDDGGAHRPQQDKESEVMVLRLD